MNTIAVNISFQKALLADIDKVAETESRSRSELLREAARLYIERKARWSAIFAYGRALAARHKLTATDVAAEIAAQRRQRSARR